MNRLLELIKGWLPKKQHRCCDICDKDIEGRWCVSVHSYFMHHECFLLYRETETYKKHEKEKELRLLKKVEELDEKLGGKK